MIGTFLCVDSVDCICDSCVTLNKTNLRSVCAPLHHFQYELCFDFRFGSYPLMFVDPDDPPFCCAMDSSTLVLLLGKLHDAKRETKQAVAQAKKADELVDQLLDIVETTIDSIREDFAPPVQEWKRPKPVGSTSTKVEKQKPPDKAVSKVPHVPQKADTASPQPTKSFSKAAANASAASSSQGKGTSSASVGPPRPPLAAPPGYWEEQKFPWDHKHDTPDGLPEVPWNLNPRKSKSPRSSASSVYERDSNYVQKDEDRSWYAKAKKGRYEVKTEG